MGIVIGIDVGISTTKIVGIDEHGKVLSPIRIRATDPVTSLYGAFGKYLHDNHIQLSDVEKVMLTGVGSAYINEPVYGLPTDKAEEFVADGLGARYETKLNRMLVVVLAPVHPLSSAMATISSTLVVLVLVAVRFKDFLDCFSRLMISSKWLLLPKRVTSLISTC